ncbi:putative ribonuclease H protein [Vitis vinifera]|uniref:Putative ribonuclease H protein n=1 Tax=Vitis vinifera TaxID=29760 RepID=A0A438EDC5_VITVI|nr:putative ribonuclease H protein [Vitis vinifera]
MFKEFYDQNVFLKSLNNTFLVLLPKKGGAEDLGTLDPSVYWGGLYKLLAKSQLASSLARRAASRGPPFPLSLCHGDGSVESSNQKGHGRGFILGCKIQHGRGRAVHIAHLLFVDDTIGVSGAAACSLLGAASGVSNKAVSGWDGVEEKVRRRLALWERQYISKGGRITLIKSTMASMPMYQMSSFKCPFLWQGDQKTCKEIFCGRGNLERKAHLVKWEVVYGDKEKGGLGIRKLTLLNKVLLGKWIWRFACDKEALWKQVLLAKYGQEDFSWRNKRLRVRLGWGFERRFKGSWLVLGKLGVQSGERQ